MYLEFVCIVFVISYLIHLCNLEVQRAQLWLTVNRNATRAWMYGHWLCPTNAFPYLLSS